MSGLASPAGQPAAALQVQAEANLRRQAEARAAFLDEFNRLLIEANPIGILVMDSPRWIAEREECRASSYEPEKGAEAKKGVVLRGSGAR